MISYHNFGYPVKIIVKTETGLSIMHVQMRVARDTSPAQDGSPNSGAISTGGMVLDVVISVAGRGLLDQSWAKYRMGAFSICATTPAIPILADVLARKPVRSDDEGGSCAPHPYLIILLPYSLIAAFDDLTWDRLEDYLRLGRTEEVEGRLNASLQRVLERVQESFKEPRVFSEIFDPSRSEMDEELLGDLKTALEALNPGKSLDDGGRLILVPVQVSGTFPLRYEKRSSSSERKVTYMPLSLEGSLLDPFVRVYVALKEIWARNREHGMDPIMSVHFDSSSGMNAVTLSALLGTRSFTEVYGQDLRLYNTDPYSVELTHHCGKIPSRSRGEWETSGPSVGIPLRVSDAESLLSTFELVDDMSSLTGMIVGGSMARSLDRLSSMIDSVRNDLHYLEKISGVIRSDHDARLLSGFLGSLRRISCALNEVIVSYAHKELAGIPEMVRRIYGRGGIYDLLRNELKARLFPAPEGQDGGVRDMVVMSWDDEGARIGFSWTTGPTFVFLDAAASLLSRMFGDLDAIEDVADFNPDGPFSVGQLAGGLKADFLLSLAIYFDRQGLSSNLSFLLGELGLKEEGIELLAGLNESDESGVKEAIGKFDEALRDFVRNFRKRNKTDLLEDLRSLAGRVGSLLGAQDSSIDLFRVYYLPLWFRNLKREKIDVLVGKDGKCDGDIMIRDILNTLHSGNAEEFVERYGANLEETLDCLIRFLTRRDVYIELSGMEVSPRFKNFLGAMAILMKDRPEEVIGEDGVMEIMRHLRAHLGLTHFTIVNILSHPDNIEIVYDRRLFERLNELGREMIGSKDMGSLCDIRIRRQR